MNPLLSTDSYKLGAHWKMLPPGSEHIFSYLEARIGAKYPRTVFFGLKPLLNIFKYPITNEDVKEAEVASEAHFGNNTAFNKEGWDYILNKYRGYLPVEIRAVPEGTIVPVGNVMMTVENTDPKLPWLTGYLETLLSQVWYPCTVATVSRAVKQDLENWMHLSCDTTEGLEFKLHDFGGRSVTVHEQAEIGGLSHLLSFKGTDTTAALRFGSKVYFANKESLGFSVPATEHSVTCAWGLDGEARFVDHMLDVFPTGIVSLVGDTYDIYNFVDVIIRDRKERILARDGKVVIRPDSNTAKHPNPEDQVVYLLSSLCTTFGGTKNSKGYTVLNPKVGVLWGDGLSHTKINDICRTVTNAGFSIDPLVFGMGSGLLQNVNRDTQRFAFKASSICINGKWNAIQKNPLDKSKASKAGRLKLIKDGESFRTMSDSEPYFEDVANELKLAFKDGHIMTYSQFDEIRKVSSNC
jgi:nicotinamide phosphoribosyltransferase